MSATPLIGCQATTLPYDDSFYFNEYGNITAVEVWLDPHFRYIVGYHLL